MTNLETDALYSIVLHPNDVFFEECIFLFNKNNLNFSIFNDQIKFNFQIKAPFYLSHLYSEKDIIDSINKTNIKDLNFIFDKKYKFISNSIIDDYFVITFENDQKLNFFKNSIIRSFDIYRKTLDPKEIKKDILRFHNLSDKEFYYYQIWGYPYYFEYSNHNIPLIKNINSLECNFSQIQYCSLKLLKQKNINNDEYIELVSIS